MTEDRQAGVPPPSPPSDPPPPVPQDPPPISAPSGPGAAGGLPAHDVAGSPVTAPAERPPLPRRADVVVIGGGIAGMVTAWDLARAGLRVVLCEKGRVGSEQSGRNWGWVRAQGRDPAELPLMMVARARWRGLAAETGADPGYRETGVLYIARDARRMARHAAWAERNRAASPGTELCDSAGVRALLPAAATPWPGGLEGGLYTAEDGRAEPGATMAALARAARGAGVTIAEHCAVRGLDLAAGRVAGVVTEAGAIAAGCVVLAGGAWSSLLLRRHGVALAQLSVRSSVAATAAMPSVFEGGASDGHLAFRRRLDGGYTIAHGDFQEMLIGPDAFRLLGRFAATAWQARAGTRFRPAAPGGYPDAWGTPRHWALDRISPFERMRILDPRPDMTMLKRMADAFARAFPGADRPVIARAWAGMIDTTPDALPAIGPLSALPGLVLATGFSGHGFGLAPAVGRVLAELIAGQAVAVDLSAFDPDRLARPAGGWLSVARMPAPGS